MNRIHSYALTSVLLASAYFMPAQAQINPSSPEPTPNKVEPIQEEKPNASVLGNWSGSLTHNTAPTSWNLQLNIAQNKQGSGFVGQSSRQPLVPGVKASVSFEIEGDLSNQVFNFREVKMIKREAPPSWYFCNMRGQLSISSENGSDVLHGPWECSYKGQRYFGEIRLVRQN